ncbi:MAG: DUF2523 domain-containing protein [Magnetococcus sp. DMHC-1]
MGEFFNSVLEFFRNVWKFVTYDFWVAILDSLEIFAIKAQILIIDIIYWLLSTLWDLVKDSVLSTSDFELLQSMFGGLPSDVLSFLSVFRFVEIFTIIMSAWVARFVIRLVLPGIG